MSAECHKVTTVRHKVSVTNQGDSLITLADSRTLSDKLCQRIQLRYLPLTIDVFLALQSQVKTISAKYVPLPKSMIAISYPMR